ncbi:MAG TPA: DUF47 family protein [Phycisphaerae bacterium]|nr:DUF47 family protein [Phycisphaerae bacterium]
MLSITPRDTSFFGFIEDAAGLLVRAAEAYTKVTGDRDHRSDHVAAIRRLRHDGSHLTRRTLNHLGTTLITPFDREDIYSLVMQIEGVVDEINAAARKLDSHQLNDPTAWLKKQAEVFLSACYGLGAAVPLLRNLRESNGLRSRLAEMHSLEKAGDDINNEAMAELYRTATDPIVVAKWKEVYDMTERAIDRCEVVANTLERIVIKNACWTGGRNGLVEARTTSLAHQGRPREASLDG